MSYLKHGFIRITIICTIILIVIILFLQDSNYPPSFYFLQNQTTEYDSYKRMSSPQFPAIGHSDQEIHSDGFGYRVNKTIVESAIIELMENNLLETTTKITEPTVQSPITTDSYIRNGMTDSNQDAYSTITPFDNSTIKFMFWTSYFSRDDWYKKEDPFKKCAPPYNNCELLTRSYEAQHEAHGLLIHALDFYQSHLNRTKRFANQSWVVALFESPGYEHHLEKFNGLFNLTWTYSRKSDIFSPYLHCVHKAQNMSVSGHDFLQGKSKMAAWFVSHCQTQSKRETYVKQLQEHIPVHIYGTCGTYKCDRSRSDSHCENLLKSYKFYLAFENSFCDDYMTEKVQRAMDNNLIPIVLGGAAYKELLPPHSYIDVKDFSSPRHLANYLQLLGSNATMYNAYFKWKESYECSRSKYFLNTCTVCKYFHTHRGQTKMIDRFDKVWGRQENCIEPKEYYNGITERLIV